MSLNKKSESSIDKVRNEYLSYRDHGTAYTGEGSEGGSVYEKIIIEPYANPVDGKKLADEMADFLALEVPIFGFMPDDEAEAYADTVILYSLATWFEAQNAYASPKANEIEFAKCPTGLKTRKFEYQRMGVSSRYKPCLLFLRPVSYDKTTECGGKVIAEDILKWMIRNPQIIDSFSDAFRRTNSLTQKRFIEDMEINKTTWIHRNYHMSNPSSKTLDFLHMIEDAGFQVISLNPPYERLPHSLMEESISLRFPSRYISYVKDIKKVKRDNHRYEIEDEIVDSWMPRIQRFVMDSCKKSTKKESSQTVAYTKYSAFVNQAERELWKKMSLRAHSLLAEKWSPLIAVAYMLGGDWPSRAFKACSLVELQSLHEDRYYYRIAKKGFWKRNPSEYKLTHGIPYKRSDISRGEEYITDCIDRCETKIRGLQKFMRKPNIYGEVVGGYEVLI